jgi:hypothetical protein
LLGVLFNGVCQGFIDCLKLVNEEQNIEPKNEEKFRRIENDINIATNGTSYDGILSTSPSCPIHIGVTSRI